MEINNLTIIVFSFNEENRISRVLDNIIGKCELLIIDNFSTDNTITIIESRGVKVVQKKNKGHLEIDTIKDILKIVKTDWLFFIQCSEIISDSFFLKIKNLINLNKYRAILYNRISFTGGTLTHNQKNNYNKISNNIVYTRIFNKSYNKIKINQFKVY